MLVRLKNTVARVGGRLLDMGVEMYFSTWSFMVLMMRFAPLGVPTKWEHVLCKLVFEYLGNVCSHKSSDGYRYAKGSEFLFAIGVSVKTEEVNIREVLLNFLRGDVLVDFVEDVV
jgi:hypothetical protein